MRRRWAGSTSTPSGTSDTLTRLNWPCTREALLHRDVDYIVRDGRIELINAVPRPGGQAAALAGRPAGGGRGEGGTEQPAAAARSWTASRSRPWSGGTAMVCGMTGTAMAVGEQLREFYRLEISGDPAEPALRPRGRAGPALRHRRGRRKMRWSAQVAADARHRAAGADRHAGRSRVRAAGRSCWARPGWSCVVLNAKNDAEEAAIVAEAGARGAITVSTQMAGRGTDIRLGGAAGDQDQVAALGGLHVIGAGRHGAAASTTSCAAAPAGRAIRAARCSSSACEDELVTRYVPDARPPSATGRDGSVTDAGGALGGRPRPAGRRRRQPGDPPQHLAVQPAHRDPAAQSC